MSDIRKHRGAFCEKCKVSSGVIQIEKFLDKNNISYTREYSFDDCLHKRKLRFDFYLPDFNMCIEYDGEQHFKPTRFGSMTQEQAEQGFVRTQQNDTIKNEYCRKNNIKLIRIPYTDFKYIHTILKEQL